MTNLDAPISYGKDEYLDAENEGTNDKGRMLQLISNGMPLYNLGSKHQPGMTAPSLYPKGLGDPTCVAIYEDVARRLNEADLQLAGRPSQIVVHSGFLSPRNQNERWKILDATRSKKTPWEEILAGRFADEAGSVAQPIDDDVFKQTFAAMKDDKELVKELELHGDVDNLIQELIMYRANNGTTSSVKVDVMTARSVHNLGNRVNVGLKSGDGELLNMGVGIDIPSPVQNANWFENNGPREYEREIDREALLREFVESMGVESVNERLINEIRDNRREAWNAMTGAGFLAYQNEVNHFAAPAPEGGMPSRQYTYNQAKRFGYKVD